MPRMKETKRAELEAFWRSHLEGWAASDLIKGNIARRMACR